MAFSILAVVSLAVVLVYGTVFAAAFIGAVLTLITMRPREALRGLVRFAPLLILPVMAALSTIWSDAPEKTLRAAIQLLVTMIAAIVICRQISARTVIVTLFGVSLAICLVATPAVLASLSTGMPLAGPFESKNQMGFAAQLLLGLAIAIVVDRRHPGALRIAASATLPFCILILALSQSAGARASAGIAALTFLGFAVLTRVNMKARVAILLLTFALLALAIAFLPELTAAIGDFRQNVLKKDATLTGRTYLWDFAARISQERPWLGTGYYAFWRQGNVDAEGLWRWGGIGARSGFNFHNAFIEMRVDLGRVGEAVFVITCAGVAAAALFRQFTRPSIETAFFLSYLLVLYIRSYTESGLIGPFSLNTFLWIATAVYALQRQAETASPIASDRRGGRTARGEIKPAADHPVVPPARRAPDRLRPSVPSRARR